MQEVEHTCERVSVMIDRGSKAESGWGTVKNSDETEGSKNWDSKDCWSQDTIGDRVDRKDMSRWLGVK